MAVWVGNRALHRPLHFPWSEMSHILHTHVAQRRAASTGKLPAVAQKPLNYQQGKPFSICFSQRRQHFKRLSECLLRGHSLPGVIPAWAVPWCGLRPHMPWGPGGSRLFLPWKWFSVLFSADPPYHAGCQPAPHGLEVQRWLASSNDGLQKGFMIRKEPLKI